MKTSSETSSNETQQIEAYLFRQMDAEEGLLFEAQATLDPELAWKIRWQQQTYALVQQYGRRQLRTELEAIYQTLFTRPEHRSFRQKILRLFSNK